MVVSQRCVATVIVGVVLASAAPVWAEGPCVPVLIGADGKYLGTLSANSYSPNSVTNPYGPYGSPSSSTSVNNPYSPYGSPYSPNSARNPYATTAPSIVDSCTGKYLGQLSTNTFAPDSYGEPVRAVRQFVQCR